MCYFLSQLPLAPAMSLQQIPKKHLNFHRSFLESALQLISFICNVIKCVFHSNLTLTILALI